MSADSDSKQLIPLGAEQVFRLAARKRKALEEEVFVDAVEEIIQRDYFPDVPRLREQAKILETGGGPVPPAATPLSHATSATDAASVLGSRAGASRDTASVLGGGSVAPGAVDTRCRLDQFLSKYTSEDNAAFLDLQDKSEERRKSTMIAREAEHLKLIAAAPSTHTPMKDPASELRNTNTRISTRFMRQQQLMLQQARQQQQQQQASGLSQTGQPRQVSLPSRDDRVRHYGADGRATTPLTAAGGGASRFGMIPASPSVASVAGDAAPIMTWGEMAATPLLIDPADIHDGPVFKVPDTPNRERIAMELAAKYHKRHAASAAAAAAAAAAVFAVPAPRTPRTPVRTPVRTPQIAVVRSRPRSPSSQATTPGPAPQP